MGQACDQAHRHAYGRQSAQSPTLLAERIRAAELKIIRHH